MIDRSPWKINDAEWLKKREKQWNDGFSQFVKPHAEDVSDAEPVEYMKKAKEFYDGSRIEYPEDECERQGMPSWSIRVALHPDPSIQNIRQIFNDWDLKTRTKFHVFTYGEYYGFIQWIYAPLIKKGLLDESIVDNFMQAMYGDSYDEAVKLRQCDPETTLGYSADNLLRCLFSWAVFAKDVDCDYLPYERLWTQVEGMLLMMNEEQFDQIALRFDSRVEAANDPDSLRTAHLPRRRAFLELFRTRMKALRNQLNPRFWPYVDALKDD
jgi:hypothetical protein